MKKILAILFLTLGSSFFTYCEAQDILARKPPAKDTSNRNVGALTINAGLGESLIDWQYTNGFVFLQRNFTYISPVYNATIDYGVSPRYAVGAGIAWQSAITQLNEIPVKYEQTTRTNITLRITGNIYHSNTGDYYSGIRFGESIWTNNLEPNFP
jgi:hypothetical protein